VLAASCESGQQRGGVSRIAPNGDVTPLTDDFEMPGVGIVVDRDDRLFVVDYSAGEVKRVSRDGETTTVARGLSSPVGLALDPEGQLYTATWGDGAIHAVTAE
jgi:hypothetical protein